MANTTTSRFQVTAYNSPFKQDNTFRVLGFDYQGATATPGISATLVNYGTVSIATTEYNTTINLGILTANWALSVPTASSNALIGDKIDLLAIGGSTTYSIVYDGTFKNQTSNTVTIGAAQNVSGKFIYNGTYWVGSTLSI